MVEINAQATRPMATRGRRTSGVVKKTFLRRDLHDPERKLSTVGTTSHEASATNLQKFAQCAGLSLHGPLPKDGSAGKSCLAKYDVGVTVAPNKKLARETDNMGNEDGCGHRKTEKSRRNNSSRVVETKAQKKDT